jgi:hypothetical protein
LEATEDIYATSADQDKSISQIEQVIGKEFSDLH